MVEVRLTGAPRELRVADQPEAAVFGYSSYRDDNWHGNAGGSRYFFILHRWVSKVEYVCYAKPSLDCFKPVQLAAYIGVVDIQPASCRVTTSWLNFVVELKSTLSLLCLR